MWKTLVGISVAVPVAAGVQYAVSDHRQRRKMRIVVEGFGRFCRLVHVFNLPIITAVSTSAYCDDKVGNESFRADLRQANTKKNATGALQAC